MEQTIDRCQAFLTRVLFDAVHLHTRCCSLYWLYRGLAVRNWRAGRLETRVFHYLSYSQDNQTPILPSPSQNGHYRAKRCSRCSSSFGAASCFHGHKWRLFWVLPRCSRGWLGWFWVVWGRLCCGVINQTIHSWCASMVLKDTCCTRPDGAVTSRCCSHGNKYA